MQVNRQAVHHHHFAGPGADEAGAAFSKLLMVAVPGSFAFEMGFHTEFGPIVQLLLDERTRLFRLQAKRMTAKVDEWRPIREARQIELVAKAPQDIRGIQLLREGLI